MNIQNLNKHDVYNTLYTFVEYFADSFAEINNTDKDEIKDILIKEACLSTSLIDNVLDQIIDDVIEDNYIKEVHDEYEPEID